MQVVLTKFFDRFSELTAGMDHVEVRIGAEIAHGELSGVKKVDVMALRDGSACQN